MCQPLAFFHPFHHDFLGTHHLAGSVLCVWWYTDHKTVSPDGAHCVWFSVLPATFMPSLPLFILDMASISPTLPYGTLPCTLCPDQSSSPANIHLGWRGWSRVFSHAGTHAIRVKIKPST